MVTIYYKEPLQIERQILNRKKRAKGMSKQIERVQI